MALALTLALAGCATTPGGAASGRARAVTPDRDGPPRASDAAPDPLQVPDAQPRVESIRRGGPNKPYEVLGQAYTPMTEDAPLVQRGLASWYGRKFHGRRTASGEVYNMHAMTAAHKTMPIPSYARVRNPANGREVIVRVNDRGPFAAGRVIDLSYAAAVKLGVHKGVAPVEVERITYEDIRAGLGGGTAVASAGAPADAKAVDRRPPPGAGDAGRAAVPDASSDGAGVAAAAPSVPPRAAAATDAVPPVAGAPAGEIASVAVGNGRPLGAEPLARVATTPPLPEADETLRAHTRAGSGYWLQLGAFAQGGGAYTFQQRVGQELAWLAPLLTIFAEGGLHRLQAGPYPTRDLAREAGEQVRAALALVPVIVERR